MGKKTTVILREEVYEHLVKKVGRRKISETINKILLKELFETKKGMFGVDPWLTVEGLRDEEEPHESP